MNKKSFWLTLIFAITGIIVGGVVGFFIGDNGALVNADDYIKNTILPVILGSGTGGGIFAIAMTLILNSLKVATTKFGVSSDKLYEAYNIVASQNKKLIENNEEIKAYKEELNAILLEVETLKKMIATGLCNTQELVKSGVATEIARIGEHKEEGVQESNANEE